MYYILIFEDKFNTQILRKSIKKSSFKPSLSILIELHVLILDIIQVHYISAHLHQWFFEIGSILKGAFFEIYFQKYISDQIARSIHMIEYPRKFIVCQPFADWCVSMNIHLRWLIARRRLMGLSIICSTHELIL